MSQKRLLLALLALAPASVIVHAQVMPKTPPAATGTPAGAGAATPAKPSPFDLIDTNHDGFISREEFFAAEKKRFDDLDTNHDGKIDAKEIASAPPLMERNLHTAERMVKQWDKDGDGIVTAEEYTKGVEERFARQDKDGTGKIARRVPMAPPGQAPGQPPQKIQPVLQPTPPAKN